MEKKEEKVKSEWGGVRSTGFKRLGSEVRVSPKSLAIIHEPGYKMQFFVPSVEVQIGIGKDHGAHLLMDEAAFNALVAGAEIHITTLKEFKKML